MFNENDILALLREGKTTDEIANDLAAALNAASKTYDAEKQAEKDAEAKKREQLDDTAILLEYVNDYLVKWYPECNVTNSTVTDEDIEAAISLFETFFTPPSEKQLRNPFASIYGLFDSLFS